MVRSSRSIDCGQVGTNANEGIVRVAEALADYQRLPESGEMTGVRASSN